MIGYVLKCTKLLLTRPQSYLILESEHAEVDGMEQNETQSLFYPPSHHAPLSRAFPNESDDSTSTAITGGVNLYQQRKVYHHANVLDTRLVFVLGALNRSS